MESTRSRLPFILGLGGLLFAVVLAAMFVVPAAPTTKTEQTLDASQFLK